LETKEQFSDGVGYGWIDTKATVAVEISDEQLANAKYKFPLQTPTSKRILLPFYFHEHFPVMPQLCVPKKQCSVQYKIALEWDEAFKNMNDPSGRAVAVCMMMRM
jgi:asparagine synthase (glutamine-hydrolysing)